MLSSPDGQAIFVASLALTTGLALVVSFHNAMGTRVAGPDATESAVVLTIDKNTLPVVNVIRTGSEGVDDMRDAPGEEEDSKRDGASEKEPCRPREGMSGREPRDICLDE